VRKIELIACRIAEDLLIRSLLYLPHLTRSLPRGRSKQDHNVTISEKRGSVAFAATLKRLQAWPVLNRIHWRLVFGLLISCGLTAATGAILVQRTVAQLLESDAQRTAEEWAGHFIKRIDIEAIAKGLALSPADQAVVDSFQIFGSVFLFKIFDLAGALQLVSDKRDTFGIKRESLAVHNSSAARVVASGRPFTTVQDGTGKANRPKHYAEAYVPVVSNGRTVAVVEVYVDQGNRYADYQAKATESSAIFALLAALAFGIPAGAFYYRSQQVARADQRVQFLARHDALTGLPNREHFYTEMRRHIAGAHTRSKTAVFCLDLDGFKGINDTLGHSVGDSLLRAVAARIQENIREGDVVARVGGDEFALIRCSIGSARDCEELAERLVTALSEPFWIDGHQVQIGTCIGISIAPDDAVDAENLLKAADLAMYRSKVEGRGAYRFFEIGMDRLLQKRRETEAALRLAIAGDEFELHYQPQYDLARNEIVGYEALIRWRCPGVGLVPPLDFIPLAEENGMIKKIGAWVLQQACRDATHWADHLYVAVNLSAVQFTGKALVLDVVNALGQSGLAPARLELELTESVLLRETQSALAILHQLKAIGVRVAMDDFGTGYSSLSYLQMFPFDKIKIDRSFVQGLGAQEQASAIVRAVISLGKSLDMKTTAEGVETAEQMELLRAEGCTQIQGYLISKAIPASEISVLAARNGVPPRLVA
jgi:diguanylate cyclase (GGDEF)-like protein